VIMNECEWLHRQLEELPLFKYPFNLEQLPHNGIYFFYENGEIWGHGGNHPRIVRIGTHKGDNFRSRISSHFLLNEHKMNFDQMKSAPSDRSIFRTNIGRVLLYRDNDEYLDIWNIDFTPRIKREKFGHLRDIPKEKRIELEVSRLLRESFSFRFIIIDSQEKRMGSHGLERSLIGTVARCGQCGPSENWLGKHSPKPEIVKSGLWLSQRLDADEINESEKIIIADAIGKTKRWIGGNNEGME